MISKKLPLSRNVYIFEDTSKKWFFRSDLSTYNIYFFYKCSRFDFSLRILLRVFIPLFLRTCSLDFTTLSRLQNLFVFTNLFFLTYQFDTLILLVWSVASFRFIFANLLFRSNEFVSLVHSYAWCILWTLRICSLHLPDLFIWSYESVGS